MAFLVKVPGVNAEGNRTNGCERAGNVILKELKEIYSNESGNIINTELLDLEEIHIDNSNLEITNNLIYKNSFEIFETKPKTIFLGGDHSISYSIGRAFLDYCLNSEDVKEPCMIVFDSRANCKEKSGEFPTNEEWLNSLIKEGFPAKNILLVGVRNFSQKETEFIKKNGVRTIGMTQLLEDLQDTCDVIMEFSHGKELYVSVDISVVDPIYSPSVYKQEPGGLTSRQFIYLIQRINKIKNLRALDIVEINEQKDKERDNLTTKLGAKILAELI